MTAEAYFPLPALVVLVGASGSGKTTWAEGRFAKGEVVSSDILRRVVGESENDLNASADAFELLDDIVSRRCARSLATVIDTTGLEPESRRRWREMGRAAGLPVVAVAIDTPAALCRERNRARPRPVPSRALDGQLRRMRGIEDVLRAEGWDRVVIVTGGNDAATAAAARSPTAVRPYQRTLAFGLSLSRFPWKARGLAARLEEVVTAAESSGFESVWVMDHLIQIPQVGREWEDLPEAYTLLAWLAARTGEIGVGTLVTSITLRHPVVVSNMIATIDVLSGGRAWCGLGAGWYRREHQALGLPHLEVSDRLDLLEDSLQLLPLMWGPGSPPFQGKVLSVPEAISYPRPIQERIPIVVGGEGEKRTLRLAAQYADACNLRGGPDQVAAKVEVLRRHCVEVGRDSEEVAITHLSEVLTAPDRASLVVAADRYRSGRETLGSYLEKPGVATVSGQVERYHQLVKRGVSTAIVSLRDIENGAEAVRRFAPVVAAFA